MEVGSKRSVTSPYVEAGSEAEVSTGAEVEVNAGAEAEVNAGAEVEASLPSTTKCLTSQQRLSSQYDGQCVVDLSLATAWSS